MFIKTKKSLGQNFLIDREVLEKIVSITDIANKDVLEIGPGSGNLTTYILKQKPKKLYVVEKDDDLAILLKEKFDTEIEIINDDILKISESNISAQKLSVFGNLPYNISTEILCKWILNIGSNFWFESLVLMFQKEVADRIISEFNNSKYGRLSILSNWKLNVKKIIDIKPQSFSPRPRINSSLLLFTPKENFFKLINLMNYKKSKEIDTYYFAGEYKKKKEKLIVEKNKSNPFSKLLALNIK